MGCISFLGFLVRSPQCEIPEVEPERSIVMDFFERLQPYNCTQQPPLSTIAYNKARTVARLVIFHHRHVPYSPNSFLVCQYMNVSINERKEADVGTITITWLDLVRKAVDSSFQNPSGSTET